MTTALQSAARLTGKTNRSPVLTVDEALKFAPQVEMRPVFFADDNSRRRIEIKGQKAIVNPATDRVYSIVTDNYQLIKHEEVIEMAEKVVSEMPEYGEPQRRVWMPDEGAMMRLEYSFPDATMKVKGDYDKGKGVMPKFDAFNGFFNVALRALFGAYRILCSNGMTVGTKEIEYRREHHQPMNKTEDLKRMLVRGMEKFSEQTKIWESWVDRVTTPAEYERVIDGLKLNKTQTEDLHREVEVSSGVRLEDQKLTAISYWIFYNLVTQYITHRIENQVVQQRMMGRVQKLFR